MEIPEWAQDPNYEFVDDDGMFEKLDDSYDCDREIFDVTAMEAYNMYGTPVLYYLTSYDKNYNSIAGEDNNRKIERVFEIMALPDQLPEERQSFGLSIENLDSFILHVSHIHFAHASARDLPNPPLDTNGTLRTNFSLNYLTADNGTGSVVWREQFMNSEFSAEFERGTPFKSYIPKAGDIIKMKFNNYLYEVKTVKEAEGVDDGLFLKHKHVWTLRIAKWVNNQINMESFQPADEPITGITPVPEMQFNNATEVQVIANGDPSTEPNTGFQDGTGGTGRFKRIFTPEPTERSSNFPKDGF